MAEDIKKDLDNEAVADTESTVDETTKQKMPQPMHRQMKKMPPE